MTRTRLHLETMRNIETIKFHDNGILMDTFKCPNFSVIDISQHCVEIFYQFHFLRIVKISTVSLNFWKSHDQISRHIDNSFHPIFVNIINIGSNSLNLKGNTKVLFRAFYFIFMFLPRILLNFRPILCSYEHD